eukprot:GHVO01005487.1.p1 GENE.GHVO01005487.1~~GHVO01005487.1.p1  ORF type:complete len:156 (-),score=39.18 GHVO01005487.1:290-757(-)
MHQPGRHPPHGERMRAPPPPSDEDPPPSKRQRVDAGTNRIIMNLPEIAIDFLPSVAVLKSRLRPAEWGGWRVYCYCFCKSGREEDAMREEIIERIESVGVGPFIKFKNPPSIREVRDVAPRKAMMVVEFTLVDIDGVTADGVKEGVKEGVIEGGD